MPLDGVRREEMQEWLDMLAELTFTGTSHDTYFDLGTQVIKVKVHHAVPNPNPNPNPNPYQVIVSAIIGGGAWNPLRPVRAPSPPAPSPPWHSSHPPPPLEPPRSWTLREQPHPPPPAVHSPPPVAQPAQLLATPLRVKLRRVKKVAASASSTPVIVLGLASALVLTVLYALRRRIMRALDHVWRCRTWTWLQFPTTEKVTEMPLNEVTGEHESLAEPDDATSTGLAEDDAPRTRRVLGSVRSSDLD